MERFEEPLPGHVCKPRFVVAKHVEVIGVPGAAVVHPGGKDSGNLAKLLGQIRGVLLASAGLLLDAGELLEQQGGLKLGHSQVASVPDIGKGRLRAPAPVVMEARTS